MAGLDLSKIRNIKVNNLDADRYGGGLGMGLSAYRNFQNSLRSNINKPSFLEGIKRHLIDFSQVAFDTLKKKQQDDYIKQQMLAGKITPKTSKEAIKKLYANQKYIEKYGLDDFERQDYKDRVKRFKDDIITDKFNSIFGENNNYALLATLTPEGKKKLIENPLIKNDKELEDYDKKMRKDYGVENATMFEDSSRGAMERRRLEHQTGGLGEFFNPADQMLPSNKYYKHMKSMNEGREKALEKIIEEDNNYKLKSTENQAHNIWNNMQSLINNNKLSTEELANEFDRIAEGGWEERSTADGQKFKVKNPGVYHYKVFKNESELKDFTPEDKAKMLAKYYAALSEYGEGAALAALETEMQNYISKKQSWYDKGKLALGNIITGTAASIMADVNGLIALEEELRGGRKALSKFLNSPYAKYWDGVDKYNTFSQTLINQANVSNGISPNQRIREAGKETDFFSYDSFLDAMQMAKFIIPAILMRKVGGKVTTGASAAADKLSYSLMSKVMPKTTKFISKKLPKLGAAGEVALGTTGISHMYSYGTYEETLQENNNKIDDIVNKEIDNDITAYFESDEGKARINNIASIIKTQSKKEFNNPISDEQAVNIAKAQISEQMYAELKPQKDSKHYKDREEAKLAAADAYAVNATAETLRMGVENALFRRWMLSSATKNQLGIGAPSFKIVNDGQKITRASRIKNVVNPVLRNVWGGMESNYLDDVTARFGKEFGQSEFNSYLANKYDKKNYMESNDTFMSHMFEAAVNAKKAFSERQSLYDGFIGGLGSVAQVAVSGRGLKTLANRISGDNYFQQYSSKYAEESGLNKIPKWLRLLNNVVYNPILSEIEQSEIQYAQTKNRIANINKSIAENKDKLEDIAELLKVSSDFEGKAKSGKMYGAKDAKQKELLTMLELYRSYMNDPIGREQRMIKNITESLEKVSKAEKAEDIKDEIDAFLGRAENKKVAESENAREEAFNKIKKNVDKFNSSYEQMNSLYKELNEGKDGQALNDNAKKELVHVKMLQDSYKERLESLKKEMGEFSVNPNENSNNARLEIGNEKVYERKKAVLEESIKKLKDEIIATDDILKKGKKKFGKRQRLTREDRMLFEKSKKTAQEQLQKVEDRLDHLNKLREEIKNTEKLIPITKEQLQNASLETLAYILDQSVDKNTGNKEYIHLSEYSQEDQQIIKEFIKDIESKDKDAVEKILDAYALNESVKVNEDVIKRMEESPIEASLWANKVVETIQSEYEDAARKKFKENVFEEITKILAKDTSTSEVQDLLKYGPKLLREYIDSIKDDEVKKTAKQILNPIITDAEELNEIRREVVISNPKLGGERAVYNALGEAFKNDDNSVNGNDVNLFSLAYTFLKSKGIDPYSALETKEERTKKEKDLDEQIAKVKKQIQYEEESIEHLGPSIDSLKKLLVLEEQKEQLKADAISALQEKNDGILRDEEGNEIGRYNSSGESQFTSYVEYHNQRVGNDSPLAVSIDSFDHVVNVLKKGLQALKDKKAELQRNKKEIEINPDTKQGIANNESKKEQAEKNEKIEVKGPNVTDTKGIIASLTNKGNDSSIIAAIQSLINYINIANSFNGKEISKEVKDAALTALESIMDVKFSDLKDLQEGIVVASNQVLIDNPEYGEEAANLINNFANKAIKDIENQIEKAEKQNKEKKETKNVFNEVPNTKDRSNPYGGINSHVMVTLDVLLDVYNKKGKMLELYNKLGIVEFLKTNYMYENNPDVVFLVDPSIDKEVQDSMASQGQKYTSNISRPIIAAIDATALVNEGKIDKNQTIPIGEGENTTYYQAIGFMPSSRRAISSGSAHAGTIREYSLTIPDINSEDSRAALVRDKDGIVITTKMVDRNGVDAETPDANNPNVPHNSVKSLALDTLNDEEKSSANSDSPILQDSRKKSWRKAFINVLKGIKIVPKSERTGNKDMLAYDQKTYKDNKSNDVFLFTRNISDSTDLMSLLRPSNEEPIDIRVLDYNSRTKKLKRDFLSLNKELKNQTGEELAQELVESINRFLPNTINISSYKIGYRLNHDKQDSTAFITLLNSAEEEVDNGILAEIPLNKNDIDLERLAVNIFKGVIFDENNNVRTITRWSEKYQRNGEYPLAKWNINYTDFVTARQVLDGTISEPSNSQNQALRESLEILEDDILESRATQFDYGLHSVRLSSPFNSSEETSTQQQVNTDNAAPPPAKSPTVVGQTTTATGNTVDSDSGKPIQKNEDNVPAPSKTDNALSYAKKIVEQIKRDFESFKITDNELFYEDLKNHTLWARVTNILKADESLEDQSADFYNPAYKVPSTHIGNLIDSLIRDFFNEGIKDISNYKNISKEKFEEIKTQLEEFKSFLDSKNITIVSQGIGVAGEVTLASKEGKTRKIRVAGTLDLLGYDNQGNFYVFDIKTIRDKGTLAEKSQKWGLQTKLYSLLLEQNYGIKVSDRFILPIGVSYDSPSRTLQYSVSEDGELVEKIGAYNATPVENVLTGLFDPNILLGKEIQGDNISKGRRYLLNVNDKANNINLVYENFLNYNILIKEGNTVKYGKSKNLEGTSKSPKDIFNSEETEVIASMQDGTVFKYQESTNERPSAIVWSSDNGNTANAIYFNSSLFTDNLKEMTATLIGSIWEEMKDNPSSMAKMIANDIFKHVINIEGMSIPNIEQASTEQPTNSTEYDINEDNIEERIAIRSSWSGRGDEHLFGDYKGVARVTIDPRSLTKSIGNDSIAQSNLNALKAHHPDIEIRQIGGGKTNPIVYAEYNAVVDKESGKGQRISAIAQQGGSRSGARSITIYRPLNDSEINALSNYLQNMTTFSETTTPSEILKALMQSNENTENNTIETSEAIVVDPPTSNETYDPSLNGEIADDSSGNFSGLNADFAALEVDNLETTNTGEIGNNYTWEELQKPENSDILRALKMKLRGEKIANENMQQYWDNMDQTAKEQMIKCIKD